MNVASPLELVCRVPATTLVPASSLVTHTSASANAAPPADTVTVTKSEPVPMTLPAARTALVIEDRSDAVSVNAMVPTADLTSLAPAVTADFTSLAPAVIAERMALRSDDVSVRLEYVQTCEAVNPPDAATALAMAEMSDAPTVTETFPTADLMSLNPAVTADFTSLAAAVIAERKSESDDAPIVTSVGPAVMADRISDRLEALS